MFKVGDTVQIRIPGYEEGEMLYRGELETGRIAEIRQDEVLCVNANGEFVELTFIELENLQKESTHA